MLNDCKTTRSRGRLTDEEDEHEPTVPVDTVPEVEVAGEGSTVDHVEDLTEDERVEDQSLELRVSATGLVTEDVVSTPVEHEADDDLVTSLTEDHLDHVDVEQGSGGLFGLPVERPLGSRVGSEGEGGESVHDQVDPQELHGGQDRLFLVRGDGGDKGQDDGGNVDRELELQELSDRVVDTSTPLDGEGQRGERVVHDDNVGSLLGDLGTRDTHGETNVGSLEGRGVVGSVTSDTDDVAELSQRLYQETLVLGGRTGHDLKTGYNLETFLVTEPSESGTFDDDSTRGVHATLDGDRSSGKDVVSGTHLDGDTGLVTLGDRLDDSRSERVLDGDDGDHGQVLGEVGQQQLLLAIGGGESTGLVILVTDGDGSETLRSVKVDGPLQVGHGLLVESDDLDVGSGVRRTVNVDVRSADLEQDFGSTLDEQPDLSVGQGDGGGHGLDFGAEGEDLVDGSGGTKFGSTGPSDLSTEQEHGSLGLGSDDADLASLLVNLLESGRVDTEGLVQKLLHLGSGDLVELGEVESEVRSTSSSVLNLGDTVLVLDLVGIGPLRVLFQSTNTLGGDTERHGDNLHLVEREGTGLVGTDDVGTSGSLTRGEHTDEQVFRRHTFSGKGEGEGDGQGQPFGDGDDDQGDGDNQDRDEILTLLVGSPVRVLLELDAESDEQGKEQGETGRGTELGDELGEPVELDLQGSTLGIGSKGCKASSVVSHHAMLVREFGEPWTRTHPSSNDR